MISTIAAPITSLAVIDPQRRVQPLADLWADRHCIVFFIRHVACTTCLQALTLIAGYKSELEALKTRLVPIVRADASLATTLMRIQRLPCVIYGDPQQEVFRTFSTPEHPFHQTGGLAIIPQRGDEPSYLYTPGDIISPPPIEELFEHLQMLNR